MRTFQLILKIIALTVVYWAVVMICKGIILYGVDNFLSYRPRVDVVTVIIHLWLCRRVIRSHRRKYGESAKA